MYIKTFGVHPSNTTKLKVEEGDPDSTLIEGRIMRRNNNDKDNEPMYQSYLLRLWRTAKYGKNTWQARLEEPRTGLSYGFSSLEDLFGFLRKDSPVDGREKESKHPN